jgi:dTDP-4-amino-4,6-dideoxygalactose transaminase
MMAAGGRSAGDAWRIPLHDPLRGRALFASEVEAACIRVIRSGRFVLGEEVAAFENECAKFLGVGRTIGVSSGTDALLVTLSALGIGPGDEVICPTFTFIATAEAIVRCGATPVLVDCEQGTFRMDLAGVEHAIGNRTRAIVAVHLFGMAENVRELLSIARQKGVLLVEDVAQSFGVQAEGMMLGSYGIAGCTSFFPSKLLGGFGDGGLIITSDERLAMLLSRLRQHGLDQSDTASRVGGNFRLDAIQAAMLRVELKYLPAKLEAIHTLARRYEEALTPHPAIRGIAPAGVLRSPFVVRIRERRDDVARVLMERGIQTKVHYRVPMHRQPAFAKHTRGGSYPQADAAAAECLSLPCFAGMTIAEVDEVTIAVRDALRS